MLKLMFRARCDSAQEQCGYSPRAGTQLKAQITPIIPAKSSIIIAVMQRQERHLKQTLFWAPTAIRTVHEACMLA